MSQGNEGILGRVKNRQHGISSLGITITHKVRKCVEVGELPAIKQHKQGKWRKGIIDEREVKRRRVC